MVLLIPFGSPTGETNPTETWCKRPCKASRNHRDGVNPYSATIHSGRHFPGSTVRKKNGRWFIFINHNGSRKAKSVGTKAAAEQVKKIIEAKLALGEFELNTDDKDLLPTFKEYATRWLKAYTSVECKASTYRSNEQLLRNHVYPRFGNRRLDHITREDVKSFVVELSDATKEIGKKGSNEKILVPRFSRSTIRLIISALRGVYNSAIASSFCIQRNAFSPRCSR